MDDPCAAVKAWQDLANHNKRERELMEQLGEIALMLAKRRGAAYALGVAGRVQRLRALEWEIYLDERSTPDLVDEALESQRVLAAALWRAEEIHRRARTRAFYLWADEGEKSRLEQFERSYAKARRLVAADPLFNYLGARPKRSRGKPQSIRAHRAAELVSGIDGLLKREIKAIVSCVFDVG